MLPSTQHILTVRSLAKSAPWLPECTLGEEMGMLCITHSKAFLLFCLWNFTQQNIQGTVCRASLLSVVLTREAMQGHPFSTHHSARKLDHLAAASLTPLISKMGLLTVLIICKAFSSIPSTKSSIDGGVYHYHAIILQAPHTLPHIYLFTVISQMYSFPQNQKLNSIWISDAMLIFLPTLCFRINTGFPGYFDLTVKEKQDLTKQLTAFTS